LTEIAAAATATSSASSAKTSSAAAASEVLPVAATVAASIWAAVSSTAIAASVRAPIATRRVTWCRAILGRIVARREILRGGLVRIRLALVFCLRFIHARSSGFCFFKMRSDAVVLEFGVTLFGAGFNCRQLV
jgi:hypothetical protein